MAYAACERFNGPGVWDVRPLKGDRFGPTVTSFTGPDAERRAREFAARENLAWCGKPEGEPSDRQTQGSTSR